MGGDHGRKKGGRGKKRKLTRCDKGHNPQTFGGGLITATHGGKKKRGQAFDSDGTVQKKPGEKD